MHVRIPRIYPLTDVALAGISHAGQVSNLVEGGASFIQLREKRLSPRQFFEEAKNALAVARQYGARIIVNDRVDLAMALGADGVHLGQDDLPPELARQLLGPEAIIGFSTHSLEQAKRAVNLPIDYLAIGPVFSTSTKADTSPEVGLAGVRSVKTIAGDLQVVAIGGITEPLIPEVLAAGADAVALISALFKGSSSIASNFRRLTHLAT